MSRSRSATMPNLLHRCSVLATLLHYAAATNAGSSSWCSCFTCGGTSATTTKKQQHDPTLSHAFRACEPIGACTQSRKQPLASAEMCETDAAKGICDCNRRLVLPTLKCSASTSSCSGRAAVCLGSPTAPICTTDADERDARKLGYKFFTFSPMIDHHVSYWLHRTGGFYDFQQHWILDFALRETGFNIGAAVTAAAGGRRGLPFAPGGEANAPLVLDVGSNLGTLTLYAAWTRCCKVHAFELQKDVADNLRRSISANGFGRHAFLHHNAVSNRSGLNVSYDAQPSNPGGVGLRALQPGADRGRVVKTVALDELFFPAAAAPVTSMMMKRPRKAASTSAAGGAGSPPNILMMKIDAEGHEMPILHSARRLLRAKAIAHIMVELRREQANEFVGLMYDSDIGYECRWRPKAPIVQKKPRDAMSRKSFANAIAALPVGGFKDAHCTPVRK